MCTAVLSIEPGLPVLLAGVRDELTDRPWQLPGPHWPSYPDLLGGKDLQAGGTWLAVEPSHRRAACVLNGIGLLAPAATRRSRGELPLLAAAGESIDRPGLADYDPFHLLVTEPGLAILRSWDGSELTEHELQPGLHFIVNSGLASYLPETGRTAADWAATGWIGSQWHGAPPPDGREHELARTAHFLGRFSSAVRPEPHPSQPVGQAWGSWFSLVNGDGIGSDDQRALIVRRDLGGGRTWGTTSVSLVALAPGWLRYDFTAHPGDESSWYPVL
jgi:Transport and Golgi organisation 2